VIQTGDIQGKDRTGDQSIIKTPLSVIPLASCLYYFRNLYTKWVTLSNKLIYGQNYKLVFFLALIN